VSRVAGAINDFNTYIEYSAIQINAQNFTIEFGYKIGNLASTNTPLCFGLKQQGTAERKSMYFRINVNNSATAQGKGVYLYFLNDITLTTTAFGAAMALLDNDEFVVKISKIIDKMVVTFKQVRTGITQSIYLEGVVIGSIYNSPQPFCPVIIPLGSTTDATLATVTYAKIIDNEYADADVLLIGDSLATGSAATTYKDSYFKVMQERFPDKKFAMYAGGGNRTQNILEGLAQTIANNPAKVILSIGTNDIAGGVALATVQANYASIVTQLKAAGIEVIHLLSFPRNGVNLLPLREWKLTTYGATDEIIDIYKALEDTTTPGNINTSYSPDTVHLNDLGGRLVGNVISQTLVEIL